MKEGGIPEYAGARAAEAAHARMDRLCNSTAVARDQEIETP